MTIAVWRIGFNGDLALNSLDHGSLLADGRWHVAASRQSVVYAGSSRALCQLEKRVHCNGAQPRDLAMLRLELPQDSTLLDVESLGLAADWKTNEAATQAIGVAWAAGTSSLGLWIPSFVVPAERNLLLNPRHTQFREITLVIEQNPFAFDPRLFA